MARTGPALFSLGLRPFFLSAALFAALAVPVWMLVRVGAARLPSVFAPTDWHIHEMLFGYAGAVITGFLFTAIPNWTGRMPIRGWPLAALLALWVAGRLAVAGLLGLGPWPVMAIDCGFPAAIAVMIVVEIVAGRNWRNLMVAGPVLLFLAANAAFHLEAMQDGGSDMSRRFGFAAVIFLITLIGGRILPGFTRNWLAKRGPGAMPAPFGRFDAICLGAGAGAMTLWTARPEGGFVGAALIAAAALHAVRLMRWRGARTLRSPLLAMLHVAYGFIPAGLAATGAAALGMAPAAAGLHLLGIGAVGGMTLAVMMRASLGHAGRALEAGPWLTAAFGMVVAAALARAAQEWLPGTGALWLAAVLWSGGFALFAVTIGPALARRRPGR